MRVITTIAEMQATARAWQREGRRLGLVPTMGCLHEGHLSLARIARTEGRADVVVVTIFVNPTQFAPHEDFAKYPRVFVRDAEACTAAGVDAIFAPEAAEMYAPDRSTWVLEERLSQPLCGKSRPTHFRGVTTVVAKLFLACLPDVAVFGQKDAQQALVIRRMVRDLNFPIEIIVAPIVRDPDGLAMSSRNQYLSPDERHRALAINRGLNAAVAAFAAGERRATLLVEMVSREITASGGRVDYVECRDTDNLELLTTIDREAVLAVTAWYGATRLLDNRVLTPPK